MNKDLLNQDNENHEESYEHEDSGVKFICPKDGEIERDNVIFLCNRCDSSQLKVVDGIYMCPSCLIPGENFQCMICDSKDVTMVKQENE